MTCGHKSWFPDLISAWTMALITFMSKNKRVCVCVSQLKIVTNTKLLYLDFDFHWNMKCYVLPVLTDRVETWILKMKMIYKGF